MNWPVLKSFVFLMVRIDAPWLEYETTLCGSSSVPVNGSLPVEYDQVNFPPWLNPAAAPDLRVSNISNGSEQNEKNSSLHVIVLQLKFLAKLQQ